MKLSSGQIARICHEANRAYCAATGDDSQPAWAEAPSWQVLSAVKGVEGILRGEILTPRQAHSSWCAEKFRTGWTYGAVKDPEAKTHPCLVMYEELPEEQQRKDALFFAIVRALA